MSPEREQVYSVLIGEDCRVTRKRLRAGLAKRGYQVVGEADTGLETVLLFDKYRPDIVLLDINMPKGNGLTALRMIHEIEPKARAIMLTGETSSDSVITAKKLGAMDYVSKTSSPDRILEALETALKGRTLQQLIDEAQRITGREL